MEVLNGIHIFFAVCFAIVFILLLACLVYIHLFNGGDEKEGSSGGTSKFIWSIVIVIAVFFFISMCKGKDMDWEPRHTQLIKPTQINVNEIIFSDSTLCI